MAGALLIDGQKLRISPLSIPVQARTVTGELPREIRMSEPARRSLPAVAGARHTVAGLLEAGHCSRGQRPQPPTRITQECPVHGDPGPRLPDLRQSAAEFRHRCSARRDGPDRARDPKAGPDV